MSGQDEAEQLFREGDQLSTKGAQARQAGEHEECEKWFRRALRSYEAALAAAPLGDLPLRLNLKLCIGARRLGLGEVEEALALFSEVERTLDDRGDLEDDEELIELSVLAKLNRADGLLDQGETDEAREKIEDVLSDFPEHHYALYLREKARRAE